MQIGMNESDHRILALLKNAIKFLHILDPNTQPVLGNAVVKPGQEKRVEVLGKS